MKTKFTYLFSDGSILAEDDQLWLIADGNDDLRCRIEAGEGGLRTDNGWVVLQGYVLMLSAEGGEWLVTDTSWWTEEDRDEIEPHRKRFGNILPNVSCSCCDEYVGVEKLPPMPKEKVE